MWIFHFDVITLYKIENTTSDASIMDAIVEFPINKYNAANR